VLEGNIPRFPRTNNGPLHPQAHMRAHDSTERPGSTETPHHHRPARSTDATRTTTHPTGAGGPFSSPHGGAQARKRSHVNVGCRQEVGPGR
jgi:hypothetical protein